MNNCNCASKTSGSTRPEPKQVGHPHAELMAQYAEEAKTDAECWKNWEYSDNSLREWYSLEQTPVWVAGCSYRRKPKPIEGWAVVYANGWIGSSYRTEREAITASNVMGCHRVALLREVTK